MLILAIDPGPERSGVLKYLGADGIDWSGYAANGEVLRFIRSSAIANALIVVEDIVAWAKPTGSGLVETCKWVGRFIQCAEENGAPLMPEHLLQRAQVCKQLMGVPKPSASQVREYLYSRYGGGKALAVGNKRKPGPLYGLSVHELDALLLALAFEEHVRNGRTSGNATDVTRVRGEIEQ